MLIILLALLLPAAGEDSPPIEQLIQKLAARETAARREAAYQLARLGPAAKPAIPALIRALRDSDKQVWSSAIGAIASFGPDAAEALPVLMESFDSKNGGGKRERDQRQLIMRSAFAISRIGPAAIPALREALQSDDPATRAGAARALGGMGAAARESIPNLVANLRRPPGDDRPETIDALALIGAEAVPALGEALDEKEATVRAGAGLALAQIAGAAQSLAAKIAEAAAREPDPEARAALLSAVPRVGVEPGRAVELLIAGVTDDREPVRHAAINAISLLRSANDRLMPALFALLRHPDSTLSERAAAVIGRLGPSASGAAPVLLEVLQQRTPPPPVFVEALGQIGPAAVTEILSAIGNGNPDALTRGHWSVTCLSTMGGGAVALLATALTSEKTAIRLVAARSLGEIGSLAAPAFPALLAATSDTDSRVRAAVLGALVGTRVQPVAAISRIETALKDASPMVRVAAVELVPQLGEPARLLAPALVTALGDPDPNVRLAVVKALSSVGAAAEPAIDSLLELLPGADAETHAAALTVFASVGVGAQAALPAVRASLVHPHSTVRAAALSAFARIAEPKQRVTILLAGLDDAAAPVRQTAARELGALGDKARDATSRLTAMLQQDAEREAALEALKQIGVRSVPELLTMLADRDPAVKAFAAERLGRLGPEAKAAVPALEAIVSGDERGSLQRNAAEALKRIRTP